MSKAQLAAVDPGGVLATEQQTALAAAVGDYSVDQLWWSSGFLAGLAAAQNRPVATTAPAAGAAATLTVLFGSQTGNGERVAQRLSETAIADGFQVELVNMADYSLRQLAKAKWLALVISTHGEGDAPDDAELLLESLQGKRAPDLSALQYAVLALGDSSYEHFCQTGHDFDDRLRALGASPFAPLTECDVDYEPVAVNWQSQVLTEFGEYANTQSAPSPELHLVSSTPTWSRQQPFAAEVLASQRITGRYSSKHVHHLELSIAGSGLTYVSGDALGVITRNPPICVEPLLAVLPFDDQLIDVDGHSIMLSEALSRHFDITGVSGAFLDAYATIANNAALVSALADAAVRRDILAQHQVIDTVREFPGNYSAAEFAHSLRRLTPRLYSIASSPLETPDEVHLTVAKVAYDAFGSMHVGSASTVLSELEVGDSVDVFIEPNSRFRLPSDTTKNIIMIGPGTGVAPFRSFIAERTQNGSTGHNWLFFGDRNAGEDFLYQTEWQRALKRGHLERMDVAFSRDQSDKVYVQDRMREAGAALFEWLESGAYIYVCGDPSRMAGDVDEALRDIVVEHGDCAIEAAEQYLKTLKREKRYLRDVY